MSEDQPKPIEPLVRPEVAPKHRGIRPVFVLGLMLALAIVALVVTRRARSGEMPSVPSAPSDWFSQNRARCNSVEVVTFLQTNDPKQAKYRAGCLALAGKISAARAVIVEAPITERDVIVNFVFQVGHPVADMGDDESAGPIMELVIEFQPDQYMALYHAGMAQAIAGNDDKARAHLTRFLSIYKQADGWTENGRRALESLNRPRAERKVEKGQEGSIVY